MSFPKLLSPLDLGFTTLRNRETTLALGPTRRSKRVAVVGAGPAGLATAVTAAQRGHMVTLFEVSDVIGGQFDLARRIPGKEEFRETIRYYTRMLDKHGVEVRLRTHATVTELAGFDEVVLATGVSPRMPDIPGIDHPMVLSYAETMGRRWRWSAPAASVLMSVSSSLSTNHPR